MIYLNNNIIISKNMSETQTDIKLILKTRWRYSVDICMIQYNAVWETLPYINKIIKCHIKKYSELVTNGQWQHFSADI